MIRILVVALFIAAFFTTSNAADRRDIRLLVSKLKTSEDPVTAKRGIKVREFKISLAPDGSDPSPVMLYYGPLVEKNKIAQMERDLKKTGLKPWPHKPALAVFIPTMMCLLYLIDEKSSGIVTHSGQLCSAWSGWIGQNTGSGDEIFQMFGGPQKAYDGIIAQALKQIEN